MLEYADDFQLTLGRDPTANIAPMKISIKKNSDPVRARPRRYAPSQREFLKKKGRELEELRSIETILEPMGVGTAHCTEAMIAENIKVHRRLTVRQHTFRIRGLTNAWFWDWIGNVSDLKGIYILGLM